MLTEKDWPLEVEDHVVLDEDIEIYNGGCVASLVVLAGTHGVVKRVDHGHIYVEFGSQLFCMAMPQKHLTLFRRSQHSAGRDEHDRRRLKIKKDLTLKKRTITIQGRS